VAEGSEGVQQEEADVRGLTALRKGKGMEDYTNTRDFHLLRIHTEEANRRYEFMGLSIVKQARCEYQSQFFTRLCNQGQSRVLFH